MGSGVVSVKVFEVVCVKEVDAVLVVVPAVVPVVVEVPGSVLEDATEVISHGKAEFYSSNPVAEKMAEDLQVHLSNRL